MPSPAMPCFNDGGVASLPARSVVLRGNRMDCESSACLDLFPATPRESAGGHLARARRDLEWPLLVESLAMLAQTEGGAMRLHTLREADNDLIFGARVGLLADTQAWLRASDVVVLDDVRGLDEVLAHADKAVCLPVSAFVMALRTLRNAALVVATLRHVPSERTHLRTLGEGIEPCTRLRSRLESAVDVKEGVLLDSASASLGDLRRRVRRLRDGIRQRIERMLHEPRYIGILQGDYFTLRDERYVLPIRAGERGDFPGIVHGQSSSGQTLFIEPEEIVQANNELRLAQLDVEAEEERILVELTAQLRAHVPALSQNVMLLETLDVAQAVGAWARRADARHPELVSTERGHLRLVAARHPLLVAQQWQEAREDRMVVPFDLELRDGKRFVVISGPNTGGKTVTLKCLGLFALMTAAGLPVPCAEGSRFPRFRSLFVDISDDQGVASSLSTFSSHVVNIASFVQEAGPGSLVLLDELFVGTDPEQGAALGRALLLHLVERQAWGVVTTHLESLKTLAFEHAGMVCASVGFDMERLAPNYQLRLGVPGASYALKIAERLGFSPVLVARAEHNLSDRFSLDREALIARLDAEVRAAAEQARRLEEERVALGKERASLARERERLKAKQGEMVDRELARLLDEARQLHQRVREARRQLDGWTPAESAADHAAQRAALEEARRIAREASERARGQVAAEGSEDQRGDDPALPPWEAFAVGARVFVRSLEREGVIAAVDERSAKVIVHCGAIKAPFARSDLDVVAPSSALPPRRPGAAPGGASGGPPLAADAPLLAPALRSIENTLDLRGERVDDAIERLQFFLRRADELDLSSVVVIHGHGTGALKQAVREQLRDAREVTRWRPGDRQEGGDGISVAGLRRRVL